MIMSNSFVCVGLGLAFAFASTAPAEVTFDWATIGNAGNVADTQVGSDNTTGYGAVAYEFRMAKTEVTNSQYAEFLNAVAATDSFGGSDPNLYSPSMSSRFGGITQTGSAGSFTYAVTPGRENTPVVSTSFIDAMRFTNWLHNGQGAGDTESGVYTITDGASEIRAPDAKYFLPSENEWYKAAYYQPATEGGDSDDYWLYPESGNEIPVAGVDANFAGGGSGPTPIGSFPANFYGLHDMGGNVREWSTGFPNSSYLHGIRGGSWNSFEYELRSSERTIYKPAYDAIDLGFRIASPVPGPGASLILAAGVAGLGRRRV